MLTSLTLPGKRRLTACFAREWKGGLGSTPHCHNPTTTTTTTTTTTRTYRCILELPWLLPAQKHIALFASTTHVPDAFKATRLPLSEPLDEGEAEEGPGERHGGVSDGRLVRAALGPLHAEAEAVDAHLAADADQLWQLPRDLLELFLRRPTTVKTLNQPKNENGPLGQWVQWRCPSKEHACWRSPTPTDLRIAMCHNRDGWIVRRY